MAPRRPRRQGLEAAVSAKSAINHKRLLLPQMRLPAPLGGAFSRPGGLKGMPMKAMLGAFLVTVWGAGAAAQEHAQIVVEARRDADAARNYVEAMAITSRTAGVLGRWNERICPGVVGAPQADAQLIIDQ